MLGRVVVSCLSVFVFLLHTSKSNSFHWFIVFVAIILAVLAVTAAWRAAAC